MKIRKATRSYEDWLSSHIRILPGDMERKHSAMKEDVFAFLRGTFYRWMQLWSAECKELNTASTVLAVGDLHVENFGTWRDSEGRLIWGVNDFDEAYPLPWTADLVRLATSAHLAIETDHLRVDRRDACEAILRGYSDRLQNGGEPFVLAERHGWLRNVAQGELRAPEPFWEKLQRFEPAPDIPAGARKQLAQALPDGVPFQVLHRVAGLGSLGRERYLALATWRGGLIAREAKALAPSACVWAAGGSAKRIYCEEVLDRAIRCRDPFVRFTKKWVVRRLAPDCSRVALSSLPKERDEAHLLEAMGSETANIHLGSRRAQQSIVRQLAKLPSGWLHDGAQRMASAVQRDWTQFRGN